LPINSLSIKQQAFFPHWQALDEPPSLFFISHGNLYIHIINTHAAPLLRISQRHAHLNKNIKDCHHNQHNSALLSVELEGFIYSFIVSCKAFFIMYLCFFHKHLRRVGADVF